MVADESLYLAYVLSEASRQDLLLRFPPKYSEVKAEHITLKFPAEANDVLPPSPCPVHVVGYADSGDGVEALAVEIDGSIHRADGSIYHITLSVDHAAGKQSAHSNELLLTRGLERTERIAVEVTPKLLRRT